MAETGIDTHNDATCDILELSHSLMNEKSNSGHKFIQSSNNLRGMKIQMYELNPSKYDFKYTDAICWSFMAIYHPSVEDQNVEEFLDTIIHVTEPYREYSSTNIKNFKEWKETQQMLSPILLYFMEKVKTCDLAVSTMEYKSYIGYKEKQKNKYHHVRNESLKMGYDYNNKILPKDNPWGFFEKYVSCGQWYWGTLSI